MGSQGAAETAEEGV